MVWWNRGKMRTPSNPLSKKIDTQSTIKAKTSMRAMASKGYFFATARARPYIRVITWSISSSIVNKSISSLPTYKRG